MSKNSEQPTKKLGRERKERTPHPLLEEPKLRKERKKRPSDGKRPEAEGLAEIPFYKILANEEILDTIIGLLRQENSNEIGDFLKPHLSTHIQSILIDRLSREKAIKRLTEQLFPEAFLQQLTRMLITAAIEKNSPLLLKQPQLFEGNPLLLEANVCQKLFDSYYEQVTLLLLNESDARIGSKACFLKDFPSSEKEREGYINTYLDESSQRLLHALTMPCNLINRIQIILSGGTESELDRVSKQFGDVWLGTANNTTDDYAHAQTFLSSIAHYLVGLATKENQALFMATIQEHFPDIITIASLAENAESIIMHKQVRAQLKKQATENTHAYLLTALMYGGRKGFCPDEHTEKKVLKDEEKEAKRIRKQAGQKESKEVKELQKSQQTIRKETFHKRNTSLNIIGELLSKQNMDVESCINSDPSTLHHHSTGRISNWFRTLSSSNEEKTLQRHDSFARLPTAKKRSGSFGGSLHRSSRGTPSPSPTSSPETGRRKGSLPESRIKMIIDAGPADPRDLANRLSSSEEKSL
jgi:hypothetical protein